MSFQICTVCISLFCRAQNKILLSVFCRYTESQCGAMLFRTPLTLIVQTKQLKHLQNIFFCAAEKKVIHVWTMRVNGDRIFLMNYPF